MASREIPESIGGDPVLLFLYKKVEAATGLRPGPEQLERLKRHVESRGGSRHDMTVYQEILENPEELPALAPFFTVNETYFFREGVHFRLLFQHVLPLLARRGRPIRICSAATSSGCEAYSIAMTVDFYCRHRLLLDGKAPAWELDAFDLNPEMIDAARRGCYGPNVLREDGSDWRPVMDLYLRPGPEPGADGFRLAGFLRDKVRFFVHNIMYGLAGFYDLIFFRNALIYFSPENRRKVLGFLFGALKDGGLLIVGVSETSSVEEPGLRMLHHGGAFYFSKESPMSPAAPPEEISGPPVVSQAPADLNGAAVSGTVYSEASRAPSKFPAVSRAGLSPRPVPPSPGGWPVPEREGRPLSPAEFREGIPAIALILEGDEGKANAARVLGALNAGDGTLDFAALAAAALSLMNAGDLPSAGLVISSLEGMGSSPAASFLRGELYYQGADFSGAEAKYQEAAAAESGFWPALYRAASLAEGGNLTRYRYRLKRALESMERGADRGYEVFIGGFSPDYYRRILEKKLAL
jgi:chemotaxis protein methyltransferase CheR